MFSHIEVFLFAASVQDTNRASEMLDTVNINTTTGGDTCGMSEQQQEIVTICLTDGGKIPVVRSEDGRLLEEVDSNTLVALSEKMRTTCYVSKDRQKESLDVQEDTTSYLLEGLCVDRNVGNDQQKSTADDKDVECGRQKVSVDEDKNSGIEGENCQNVEKVKDSVNRSDEGVSVRGTHAAWERRRLSVCAGHKVGVEHEWQSSTDGETDETSDDDNDVEVVTVTEHAPSDSDDEEVEQFPIMTM